MTRLLFLIAMLVVRAAGPALADVPAALADPYLRIQVALANDKVDGVQASALALAAEAERLGTPAEALRAAARSLASARDLNAARTAFGPLSDALIAYANRSGLGPLKVAFCPMLKKSWVQKPGDIANPYFGSQMLRCGSFK